MIPDINKIQKATIKAKIRERERSESVRANITDYFYITFMGLCIWYYSRKGYSGIEFTGSLKSRPYIDDYFNSRGYTVSRNYEKPSITISWTD